MTETLFDNARNRVGQSCPPIWMMRQAGRYQASYRAFKEKFSFEQMCKLPQIASDVAMLPIKEYDFDVAILFSDILFHIESLGIPLKFNPSPKFEFDLTEENYKNHLFKQKSIKHLEFQARAIKKTKEKLPFKKNLVGFVGGPWTLMNYACGESKVTNQFKIKFIKDNIVPLLQNSIRQQTKAGADSVMIFDSGLHNMPKGLFDKEYCKILEDLASLENTVYYSKNLPYNSMNKLIEIEFSGIGIDSTVDLPKMLQKVQKGFVQGNFDETLLLQNSETILRYEIKKWLDTVEDTTGWVCGLGHGILKDTPPANVRIFVDMVRNHFR